MTFKDVKYIIISVIKTIWHDLKSSYDSMAKPRDVMNLLFFLCIVEMAFGKWNFAIITAILYFLTYIWKIVQQGDWKKMERDEYKQKIKN